VDCSFAGVITGGISRLDLEDDTSGSFLLCFTGYFYGNQGRNDSRAPCAVPSKAAMHSGTPKLRLEFLCVLTLRCFYGRMVCGYRFPLRVF
jgi:hypothetical protein